MEKTERESIKNKSFTTKIVVTQTPAEVFNAISNVRGWWSEAIEGITDRLNAEFIQYYQDIHIAKMKIVEFMPGKKVTWLVLDNHFSFTKDEGEWKGTKICFEISVKRNQPDGHRTQLVFTHQGLVPEYECYDVCNHAWNDLIKLSLRGLITNGKGRPNPKEKNSFPGIQHKRWKLSND